MYIEDEELDDAVAIALGSGGSTGTPKQNIKAVIGAIKASRAAAASKLKRG